MEQGQLYSHLQHHKIINVIVAFYLWYRPQLQCPSRIRRQIIVANIAAYSSKGR